MFVAVGALGILVMLVRLRVYRDPTLREQVIIRGQEVAEVCANKQALPASWCAPFRQRNTYFMILGAFGIFCTVWVYPTWLPSYLQTSRGLSLSETGWLSSLPYLCGILGVLFGGWLSGRLIRRGHSAVVSRKVPIVGGAVLAAAAVLPVAYVHSTPLALSLGYFAAQVPMGCLWTLASDIAESHQVASLGAIQNFGGFLVGGALLLFGGMSYLFFVKERRPWPPPHGCTS
ncbi:MFS transporter [Streptomyces sp. NBC_01261]|uniref:MFS transporter n=1 Tax=Streptomyces sp. NBC_01261 TaxID=2903802 RepID=UPI002E32F005|nr:MFS transporter [Streptomyces sp. NBC_01261]